MEDKGYIKIETFTANQGIPIGKTIGNVYRIIEGKKELIGQLITDNDGISNTIELPTSSSAASQTPSDIAPYTLYDLEIIHPGYMNKYFPNIPIFPNVISIQKVPMEIDYNNIIKEKV